MTEFDILTEAYVNILPKASDGRSAVASMTAELVGKLAEAKVEVKVGAVLADENGKITAVYPSDNLFCRQCGDYLDSVLISGLADMNEELDNVPMNELPVRAFHNADAKEYRVSIFPIVVFGGKVGSLMVYSKGKSLTADERQMCIGVACLAGLIMGAIAGESKRDEIRKRETVRAVTESLSYSELLAAGYIFDELSCEEGLIVASRIADSRGITRSVIVNAIRKLESAGIIESRSLGMKGTYIKVINEYFAAEMAKLKK
jgi:transcriptional pleiotropic repressor